VEISLRKTFFLIALTLSCAAAAKPAPTAGDVAVKPTPTQAQTAVLAARFLTRFHYKPEALDAKMSQQIFDRYLDALDSDRLFLLQSDVDRFAASRDKLGDAIYDQDLTAPFAIFNLYVQRVAEHSRAERIGLKMGDQIRKVDGKDMTNIADLRKAASAKEKGLIIEINREGTDLKLEEKAAQTQPVK